MRHWRDLTSSAVFGSDYNSKLVDWCDKYLPDVRVTTNQLQPPLEYDNDQFGFIYSASVFTHLPEDLQYLWIKELSRILRPGGRLLFTTHGESLIDRMQPEEAAQFAAGKMVVRFGEVPGSNLCSTYHPYSWIEQKLLTEFQVLKFVPGGEPGLGQQDLYVVSLTS